MKKVMNAIAGLGRGVILPKPAITRSLIWYQVKTNKTHAGLTHLSLENRKFT